MKKNIVSAHCDGPCGVYDPASARIAAEAVLSMTKKNAWFKSTRFRFYGSLCKYYE